MATKRVKGECGGMLKGIEIKPYTPKMNQSDNKKTSNKSGKTGNKK